MKALLTATITIFSFLGISGHANARMVCAWQAEKSASNFMAEDELNSLESCSFFVRGMLIGARSGWLGDIVDSLLVGDQVLGTLTFVGPDGDKRICHTELKKVPPDELNQAEAMAAYLKAERDGGALSADELRQVQGLLQELNIGVKAVAKKIDDSVVLKCFDQVS